MPGTLSKRSVNDSFKKKKNVNGATIITIPSSCHPSINMFRVTLPHLYSGARLIFKLKKKDVIDLFSERGEGREKKRERD